MKLPTVLYPTLIRGLITGPIRCETLDGSEMWLPPESGKITMAPFTSNGKTWFVSHMQKKATYFSLLYNPWIYHYGCFWHLQEQTEDGTWKPGTERGIYWRTPGWRWDSDPHLSSPWIWSWGRGPGGHLD